MAAQWVFESLNRTTPAPRVTSAEFPEPLDATRTQVRPARTADCVESCSLAG